MPMSTLTTEKLGHSVGAEVVGVDCDRLLHDEAFPASCLQALEENGALVFRDLHIDDATQVAFSRKLGKVEVFGNGELPEIFRVTLDPAKNRAAAYLRGTFDWHLDGATDDIPIMATVLSAHAVAASGGETEFTSTYAAYDDLDEADQRAVPEGPRRAHLRSRAAAGQPRPVPEGVGDVATAAGEDAPAGLAAPVGAALPRPRRDRIARGRNGHDEGRALLAELLAWSTSPDRVFRHEWSVGDMVIWDNRGVLHRALPYDASSARDMHRTTISGDEPIQ